MKANRQFSPYSSAIGILAVADAKDFQRIASHAKANTIITQAETQLRRIVAMETLDIAGLGKGKLRQAS